MVQNDVPIYSQMPEKFNNPLLDQQIRQYMSPQSQIPGNPGFMMMEPPLGESPMFNVKNQKLMNQYQHPFVNDLFNFHSNSMNSFRTAADSGSFQLPQQGVMVSKVQPEPV